MDNAAITSGLPSTSGTSLPCRASSPLGLGRGMQHAAPGNHAGTLSGSLTTQTKENSPHSIYNCNQHGLINRVVKLLHYYTLFY